MAGPIVEPIVKDHGDEHSPLLPALSAWFDARMARLTIAVTGDRLWK